MRYRIGIINDFKNSTSFIDYRVYGSLQIWDACNSSGENGSFCKSSDSIKLFLNFKPIGEFKTSQEVEIIIKRLIEESPVDLTDLKHHILPLK